MGVLPTVLGIAGVCICWLPLVGWLGVAMGLAACGMGVVSIIYWYEKPGYTGWGVAGLVMGVFAGALGFAYQIKHSQGQLDHLYHSISASTAFFILLGSIVFLGVILRISRKRPLLVWLLATYLVIITNVVTASSALVTADRGNQDVAGCKTKETP